MIAGRPGAASNKGNPSCIGVGLMRKLSKRFLVAPTPEAYTSKTCSRCFGDCRPCSETEDPMGKKIRGLRRCTQRDCMLFLNRDKNGATNIGTNFDRLFEDKPPIRSMTDEDLAFHRATDLLSLPRRHMYYLQNTLLALPLISCCRRPNMRLIRLHPEG